MTVTDTLTIKGTVLVETFQRTLRKSTGDFNSSARLDITVDNRDGIHASTFNYCDPVTLSADGTDLFAGQISEIAHSGKDNTNTIRLVCRDFNFALQTAEVEPEVFSATEISVIVKDIISKYAPSFITTTNVVTTPVILDRIAFNFVSVFDALRQLAELAGDYFFFVDTDGDLNFKIKSQTSTGITLDSTNVTKSDLKLNGDNVKNRIFVYGDRQLVAHPTETFIADGVGSVFTLDQQPHNTKTIASGIDQVGGIFNANLTPTSGLNYLVNFFDQEIIFISGTDLGDSIPGSLDVVTVDYQQAKPIVKLVEDTVSQVLCSGVKTLEIIDTNIKDPITAEDIAKSQLALRKDPRFSGKINLQGIVDLTPGETVVVNLPTQDQINETYDILESTYTFNSVNNLSERVLSVVVSERIPNINDVLKELVIDIKRLKAKEIDTTAVITRLQSVTGSYGIKSNLTLSTVAANDSFILDNGSKGIITNYLGDNRGPKIAIFSGGTF